MPTLDLSGLATNFDMNVVGTADFASYLNHGSTFYTYISSNGHAVTLIGTGITVDGSNMPTGGTITHVRIDLGNNNIVVPDVDITDLNFALTDINLTSGYQGNLSFWASVLAGKTDASDPNGQLVTLHGDGIALTGGARLVGGDDSLIGEGGGTSYLRGEVLELVSSFLIGGNDTLTGAFDSAIGEASFAGANATVIGGDDVIRMTADAGNVNVFSGYGDVYQVQDSTVIGGDDILDFSVITSDTAFLYGDVYLISGASTLVGGNDLIMGTNGPRNSFGELSVGDAYRVDQGAVVFGGNDTIYGLDHDDFINGDFYRLRDNSIVEGGDDSLFGGNGNDTITGDVFSIEAGVSLVGGNDSLSGGAGNDLLYGNGGDDTLNGGTGNDSMDGGAGEDWVSYEDETSGAGVRLDTGVPFGAAAGDAYLSIEHAIGSGFNDTIVGTTGENHLIGGGGNDTIYALDGEDTLDGGDGDDALLGQDGDDVLMGSQGDDTLNGGIGDDTVDYGTGTRGGGIRLDGQASWGVGDGDSYIDIENVAATDFRDVVVGSTGHNRIETRDGNDTVYALGGNDTIDGGAGDDLLFGQGGSDRFVFSDGYGDDTISGFDAGDANEDIDLSGVSEITDFTDLQTNHMTQVGADVVIDDGLGNTITLLNTNLASLDTTDFVF